ncbi:MAG: alpha/beta fold hydrolase [Thermocrispum sp.]
MTSTTFTSFTLDATGGTPLTVYRWDPPGQPRGIAQITHGMGEHARRYDEVAQTLAAAGMVVYAQDHRGHGASATSHEQLGRIGADGWTALVADLGVLNRRARANHPGLPLVLLAHSMGSFATQQYLLDHSDTVDGVVITGTAVLDLLEPALDLDKDIDLTEFNAAFQPPRTEFDWLSRDDAIVDAYIADPLCGFGLDNEAGKAMFAAARLVADPRHMARVRSDLPLYLAVGELDPVNAGLAVFQPLVDRYHAAGLDDVTVRTYPDARHEILNETNRDEVIGDIVDWSIGVVDRVRQT